MLVNVGQCLLISIILSFNLGALGDWLSVLFSVLDIFPIMSSTIPAISCFILFWLNSVNFPLYNRNLNSLESDSKDKSVALYLLSFDCLSSPFFVSLQVQKSSKTVTNSSSGVRRLLKYVAVFTQFSIGVSRSKPNCLKNTITAPTITKNVKMTKTFTFFSSLTCKNKSFFLPKPHVECSE